MSDDEVVDIHEEGESKQPEEKSGPIGPLQRLLPPDLLIWNEARKIVGDKNSRIEDLATCVAQDPVLVIDLLNVSNAMYYSAGRPPITSIQTALVRLGSDVVLERLEDIHTRLPFENSDVQHWLELYRAMCRRTSIVARVVAEAVSKNLANDCATAGVLTNIGDMIAVAHFQENYVSLAEELSRSRLNYRIAQDYKFDVEKVGASYLRKHGIPESILFALERDAGRPRSEERAVMRPICFAAAEMVTAFDANRWEKLAPGKKLPAKSAIRMLKITDAQYLRIYERISEFLFAFKLSEERRKQEVLEAAAAAVSHQAVEATEELSDAIAPLLDEVPIELELEDEIQNLLSSPSEDDVEDLFSLGEVEDKKKAPARVLSEVVQLIEPPKLHTEKSSAMVANITAMFDLADNSEDLLSGLLEMLVDDGPFEKTALIVVSKDRKDAIVVAARGPIGNGQTLVLDDVLSPLAQCFSKVQSFGNKESKNSPFGSKSYALAPIDADHDTPVALYADCGNDGAVSFEARRVFRTVVEILNTKLPQIPGGIPVELAK